MLNSFKHLLYFFIFDIEMLKRVQHKKIKRTAGLVAIMKTNVCAPAKKMIYL
jgi:hypothetical protein